MTARPGSVAVRRTLDRLSALVAAAVGRLLAPIGVGLAVLLYVVSSLVPRREDLWVFGAAGGAQFVGNPKYQFLHVVADHDDVVRAVWLTRDEDVLAGLRAADFEVYRAESWRGRYLTLRAGTVFTSHGVGDVAKWVTGGADVVQLWHGVALKRIGLDADREWSLAGLALFYLFSSRWDRLVVTSREQAEIFAGAFPVDREAVEVTGYPRNDALVRTVPGEDALGRDSPADRDGPADGDGPLLAYVPTWRRGFGDQRHGRPLSAADLDLGRLERLLARHDAHLFVKLHPRDRGDVDVAPFDRISSVPTDVDVNLTLRTVDVLITDYSSVYFDFLHLDRPIVFFPYDREQYVERPGLYYDYDAVTPGPVATSGEELLTAVGEVLDGTDGYEADRRRIRERLFASSDGLAAERVYRRVRG